MTPRLCVLPLDGLAWRLEGQQGDAVILQDLLDVRLPAVDDPLEPGLQLPVSLLDAHGELEAHGQRALVFERNDLKVRRRVLFGEVSRQWPPDEGHIDLSVDDVLD